MPWRAALRRAARLRRTRPPTTGPAAASWPTRQGQQLPTSVQTTAVLMERVLTDPPLSDPTVCVPLVTRRAVTPDIARLTRIKTTRCVGTWAPGPGDARLAVKERWMR